MIEGALAINIHDETVWTAARRLLDVVRLAEEDGLNMGVNSVHGFRDCLHPTMSWYRPLSFTENASGCGAIALTAQEERNTRLEVRKRLRNEVQRDCGDEQNAHPRSVDSDIVSASAMPNEARRAD